MKKAVRKGASKAVALVLSLAMILGMAPMVGASAGNTADAQDNFDRIVHLDMGRKYFTPESIKTLIDEMAKLGYNQLELDFGNSEAGQLRFALSDEDMQVEYTYSVQTMVPVEDMDAQEEPAAPVETGEPVEEQPAAPVQTEKPVDEEQTAETVMPLQEEPAVPAETVAPTAPVTDEALEQAEESGTAGGVIEYTYINEEKLGTINLGAALPEDKDGKKQYITEAEMVGIIEHAESKGIEIVPLLNSPGHFGAVLEAAPEYRYSEQGYGTSQSSLDVTNSEARAFGIAVVKTYANWFREQGCDTFNIGADEFANDIFAKKSGMGFGHLQSKGEYDYFVSYVNALYDMLTEELGYTTVRAFNDGFYYGGNSSWNFNKGFEICYWSSGWGDYKPASAQFIQEQGHSLVNTHGDYYFVLKTETVQCPEVDKVLSSFENESFMGGYISNPAGSMFCIWCDEPNAIVDPMDVVEQASTVLPAFAYKMQGGETGTGMTYEQFITPRVTDKDSGVSAAAQGLTDIVVKSHTAKVDALESPAYQDYVAYNITLNGGEYTEAAAVTIPLERTGLNGVSENLLRGFVVNQDGSVKMVAGTLSGTDFTFTAPHFSTVGVVALTANTQDVTVSVGSSATISVPGQIEVADSNWTTEDGRVEVTVTYTPGTGGYELREITSPDQFTEDGQYLLVNNSYRNNYSGYGALTTTTAETEREWVWDGLFEGHYVYYYGLSIRGSSSPESTELWSIQSAGSGMYYILRDGQYLEVTLRESALVGDPTPLALAYSNGSWTIGGADEAYLNNFGADSGNGVAGGWTGINDSGSQWTIYERVYTPAEGTTTITFTGVSEGTTTVTIGGTVYQIKVVPESLNGVKIEVDYFITNKKIKDINGNTSEYIYASEDSVYSEGGALFSDLVLGVGYTDLADTTKSSQFWKGTKLDEAHHQYGDDEEKGPPDQTKNGYDFTYIRYWGGTWGVSADGTSWENVNSGDQLVAYYLQVTDVTDEVTTKVVDWGEPYSAWVEADSDHEQHWFWDGYVGNGTKFIFLDFAVVYEDNTQNPSTFPVDNTWFYHYDVQGAPSRVLNPIYFMETDEYEIYKITVQNGTCGNTYSAAKNFKPTYSGEEVTIWTEEDGTEPSAELTYTANRSGKLLRIYVRTKQTEDSLTVHYMEGTPNSAVEFYQYYIDVPAGTSFDAGFALDSTNEEYGLKNNSVENTLGVTQHVSTHLDSLPEISAEYRGSQYVCTEVIRSEDGREVYLYYTFNDEGYEFVVDYGLPLVISATDLGLDNNVWTSVEVANTPLYGSAVTSTDNNKLLTYTPNAIIQSSERIRLTLKDSKTDSDVTHTIYFIPASTVYYEAEDEDFVKTSQDKWERVGNAANTRTQAADKLGDANANNYGSDPSYKNATESSSNGAALKVTVNQDLYRSLAAKETAGETVEEEDWPYATFTFTGTGVDIISQTDSDAGVIIVKVKNTGTAESERYYVVNNYYGYSYSDGTWTPTTEANGNGIKSIYQVPVISIQGLPHGNHQVQIFAVYSKLFDMHSSEEDSSYNFYLDAIRVYNPLGDDDSYYSKDGEANAQFISIHDKAVENAENANKTFFVDGLPNASFDQFKIAGPYNEVYLAPGQSVTITVDEMSGKNVQIGARLISGSSASLTVGNGITVNSTVDQYYEVTGVTGTSITIKNNSNSTVALTTLKLTGSN